jgi:hypothetical protein
MLGDDIMQEEKNERAERYMLFLDELRETFETPNTKEVTITIRRDEFMDDAFTDEEWNALVWNFDKDALAEEYFEPYIGNKEALKQIVVEYQMAEEDYQLMLDENE